MSTKINCAGGTQIEVFNVGQSTDLLYLSGRLIDYTSRDGEAVEVVDITHSESAKNADCLILRQKKPAAFIDKGRIRVTIHHDKDVSFPTGVAFDFQTTYPLESGESTATKEKFTGFATSKSTTNPPLQPQTTQTTLDIEINGDVTLTVST